MKVLTMREKNVKGCNPHLLKKINFPAGHNIVNGTNPVGWWERFLPHFPGETSVSSPYKDDNESLIPAMGSRERR